MKNILFIADVSLKNPIKGTPLRMLNLITQISKENNVFICSRDVRGNIKDKFYLYPSGNILKRLIYFLKIIQTQKIDIVFANTDIEIRPAVFMKLFSKVKIVIDLHGLYAEELYYEGLIGNLKRFIIDRMIRFLLRFYDLIFVACDNLREYYRCVNKNIEIIYNGVNLKDFYPRRDLRPNIFTIGYTGNLKSYQGFEYLLRSLKNIKNKNLFKFRLNIIISSGAAQIENLLKNYDLFAETDVQFKLDHDKINEVINQSNVLVVPRPSLKITEYAYPSKLPEYMLTGIPVITTNVGPVQTMLGECGCCIIINSDNIVNDLEEALIEVYRMDEGQRDLLGIRAVDFVKNNLTWDVLGRKLNQYLFNL